MLGLIKKILFQLTTIQPQTPVQQQSQQQSVTSTTLPQQQQQQLDIQQQLQKVLLAGNQK